MTGTCGSREQSAQRLFGMKSDYSVYCHTLPSGRKYVGISCNPVRRWNNGKGYKKNYLFYRAIEKYGWDNIEHSILHEGLTLKEAKAIEKKLIAEWKLTDAEYGLNLSGGGDGILADSSRELMSKSRIGNNYCKGRTMTAESRARISESLKEYYKTNDNQMKGKHHTEETKQKLRSRVISEETKARMRKHHANVSGGANPSAKAVEQYTLEGEYVQRYSCAKEACIKYGIDLSRVIKCCRGKAKSCGGYTWKYAK